MCLPVFQTNTPFQLEYVELNMFLTNAMWERVNEEWETASCVYRVAIAFLLFCVAVQEIIKNGILLFYNEVVFVINTASDFIYQISNLFSKVIKGESPTLNDINLFGQPQKPQIYAIQNQFSPKTLLIFKSAMRAAAMRATAFSTEDPISKQNPLIAYLGDHEIATWYNLDDEKIYIQDKHQQSLPTLALKISGLGYISSIQVDGRNQEAFPGNFEPYMRSCFQQAFIVSSRYQTLWEDEINIQVVRDGLKEVPDYHFKALAKKLAPLNRVIKLRVEFLDPDLKIPCRGLDGGGPSRDYMDELWAGILSGNSQVLQFEREEQQNEAMPKASGSLNNDGIPSLSPLEQSLLQDMGVIIAYCYLSTGQFKVLIGRRLEETLFKALFSLTDGEVDNPNLPFSAQLKMMKVILECRGIKNDQLILLLEKWIEKDLNFEEARKTLKDVFSLEVPKEAITEKDQEAIINLLKTTLYESCNSDLLAPIHFIAKGIKQFLGATGHEWNSVSGEWKQFSNEVQGGLDRNFIADKFVLDENAPPEVSKKAGWLIKWLKDPQTPDEHVQDFIKHATGSSSLRNDGFITIASQVKKPYYPVPFASTCFNEISLSPKDALFGSYDDETEESFIKSLRALTRDFNYGAP